MTHQEMQELYEFYALGLLEEGERAEIDEHLRTGCAACQSGVRRAKVTNAAILSFAPDVAPPKRLRKRVLAGFGVERVAWGWIAGWATLTAGLLLGTLWFATDANRVRSDLAAAREQAVRASSEAARVQTVLDFLNAPETRQVTFGRGEQQQPPRGSVFVNPKSGVLLIASNLPALGEGKTFEMWLIPKGGAPRPAGLFKSDPGGKATHIAPGAIDPSTSAVAISVEPEAGSSAPTTTPIMVTSIASAP
ncbi:MAG: anti-sigma factor [Acidobacteria bacterium]|nr:anti-sigma factor [Acidobacteriota bacterium]